MNTAAASSNRAAAVEATERMRRHLGNERTATADFLLELARFDERQLWRELGYGAAFPYLRGEFKLSKSAAYQRLVAARLIQRYPAVEAAVRTEDLCLSSIHELAKVITPENAADVLPRFFGASAREAAEIAASLKPVLLIPIREVVTPVRPDAAAVRAVRVLTAGSTVTADAGTAAAPPSEASAQVTPKLAPAPDGAATERSTNPVRAELVAAGTERATNLVRANSLAPDTEPPSPQTGAGRTAGVFPGADGVTTGSVPVVNGMAGAEAPPRAQIPTRTDAAAVLTSEPASSAGGAPSIVLQVVAEPPRDEIQPLDGELARLHLTVTRRFLEKLDAAKDRLAHACRGRTAADVLEHCLDVALADHARRNGIVENPRKQPRPSRGRHIPAHVKREVIRRAGGWRCEWILENGKRCDCTRRLQFDHIQPVALGGESTVENVRLVCQAHNLLAARRIFGDVLIDRFAPAQRPAAHTAVQASAAVQVSAVQTPAREVRAPTTATRDPTSTTPAPATATPDPTTATPDPTTATPDPASATPNPRGSISCK